MNMKSIIFIALALVSSSPLARAVTNDLGTALQRGLFEEEANHNLDAAIQAYQSVVNQYDKDRKMAATAVFRLGESYRKQGKTNEASAQYERVVREFADQPELATISRQNLAALGRTPDATAALALPSAAAAADAERAALDNQIAALRKLSPEKLRIAVQQEFPNPVLTALVQKLAEAE